MKIVLQAKPGTLFQDISIDRFPFEIGRNEPVFDGLKSRSPELRDIISFLSGKHASVSVRENRVYIADRGSRNGTRLNGVAVGREPVEISHGDLITIAEKLEYRVLIPEEAVAPRLRLIPREETPPGEPIVIETFPFLMGRKEEIFDQHRDRYAERLRALSRKHAEFTMGNGTVYVEDLGSSNGTEINGERLSGGPRAVSDGDLVVFGKYLTYRLSLEGVGTDETVVLGREEMGDRTVIVPPEESGAADSDGTLVDAPVAGAEAERTTEVAPPVGEETLPPPPEEAASGDEAQEGGTVYMSSPIEFLKIIAHGEETPESPDAGQEKVPGAADKRQTRKGLFIRQVLAELRDDSEEGRRRRKVYALICFVVLIAGLTIWGVAVRSPELKLKRLMAEKRYSEYLDMANLVLATKPGRESIRDGATEALIRVVAPEFSRSLNHEKFNDAEAVLAGAAARTGNNPEGLSVIELLQWTVDLERYFQQRLPETPVMMFRDEKTIGSLLRRWDENTGAYRRFIDQITTIHPSYAPVRRRVFSNLVTLQDEKSTYLKAIAGLERTLDGNDERPDLLISSVKDFQARFPRVGNTRPLAEDAARYAALWQAVTEKEVFRFSKLMEGYEFQTPPFAEKYRRLRGLGLPPDGVVERYRIAVKAWSEGDSDTALALYDSLSGEVWGEVASAKRARCQRVLNDFSRVKSARGTSGYGGVLTAFYNSLLPGEDGYYFRWLEKDLELIRERELGRAATLFAKAEASWNQYTKRGRISALQRLEVAVSGRFRRNAALLSDAQGNMAEGTKIYKRFNRPVQAKWAALGKTIADEVETQRVRLQDLRGALGEEVATAKLNLLPKSREGGGDGR